MAPKPTVIPRWNTGTAARVDPGPGKRASGFANGERPPAKYVNWLLHYLGEWTQYLSDGVLDALQVTGGLQVNGTFQPTGLANLSGVTGLSLPTFKRQFPAALGQLSSGTATWSGGYWLGGGAGTVYLPLDLNVGDRIKKIYVRHRRGGGTPVYSLKRLDYAMPGAAIASVSIAAGSADAEDVIDNGAGGNIDHVVADGYQYILEALIGNAADRFYMATVWWDRPG